MSAPVTTSQAWPPFPIEQLPLAVQGLFEDFRWAPIHPHPPVAAPLVTVVVPCFNPDPQQFGQLLLSLQQQSDQAFDLLLVNDGSSPEVWSLIQEQLDAYPWVEVLHQSVNGGISAALNAALAHLSSPYVAFVDQDDLLHPGAVALVRRHLELHPDCALLYSDHIVFDDTVGSCNYIPKFPWNSEALLEFNFLIHLTVVRVELFFACGGMNSHFDGIQDWEFYLRLAPFLSAATVGYLPIPLYAWRLSDRSAASSARPKALLLQRAQEFLVKAHSSCGAGSSLALPVGAIDHYHFLVDRTAPRGDAQQTCNLLLLAGSAGLELISRSLLSLVACKFPVGRLFVALDSDGLPCWEEISSLCQSLPRPELLLCSLQDLHEYLPADAPLMVLQAGASLEAVPGYGDLPGWLERGEHWDLLTLPGFNQADGCCISAGYSRGIANQEVYLPHGQGLTRKAYSANFASFGHARMVDLPSPPIQLLRSSCLVATLEAWRQGGSSAGVSVSTGWWCQLNYSHWRCCCLANLVVLLPSPLVALEHLSLVLRESSGVALVSARAWVASHGQGWEASYGALLGQVLEKGPGRVHPLHVQAFFAGFLHPAVLQSVERCFARPTLLPAQASRPLVMLIPTELNARSNGHACMLTLALQLQAAGQPVHLLPYKPYTFFRHYFPRLPPSYRHLPFIAEPSQAPGGVLLVPESAPRKLVKRLRLYYDTVLWWLLAPAGLLTAFRPDIRVGDRLVAFSEFTLPNQTDYLFVHPKADPLLRRLEAMHVPFPPSLSQVALYTGKGRLKPLPRSLHRHLLPFQVVLITRSFPRTKAGLIRLLEKCHGLISCDPMTNLSLEAANLGVPTFLTGNPFPARCYRHFPIDLREFITDSPGEFISKLNRPGSRLKLPAKPLYRKNIEAAVLVRLLTSDPEPLAARAFRVDAHVLDLIESYRGMLVQSRTIQTALDGQSLSSAFSHYYLLSLKAPYSVHFWFCRLLGLLDWAADALLALGLFTLLRPLINTLSRVLRVFARLLAPFSRRLSS